LGIVDSVKYAGRENLTDDFKGEDKLEVKRLDAPGTFHPTTVRGIEKYEIVDNPTDIDKLLSRLEKKASQSRIAVCGWSLMASSVYKAN